MRILDKTFTIKSKKINILFTFTPRFWKMTKFQYRKTIIFYPARMLNIFLLGFQFRLIIGKNEEYESFQKNL
jgi:hypothetical protein